MRSISLAVVTFLLCAIALVHPYVGALTWTWISLMSPHRLTWDTYDFPFAQCVAIATFIGIIFTKDPKKLPINDITLGILAFGAWICVTTVFAFYPELCMEMLKKVLKILVMTLVAIAVLRTRKHIDLLVWVIVGSLGFFGVKGGIFTIVKGGTERVWGPPGTFVEGNNELALALVMTIPLMRYLQLQSKNTWVVYLLWAMMLLSAVAALGTHSRGGLVAIAAMGGFLWIKSRKKLALGVAIAIMIGAVLNFAPENWFKRMETIRSYEEDSSAMGRINSWGMALNLAKDRPIVGGGFEIYNQELFSRYSPNKNEVPRAAHSIYFQTLGQHGYAGLLLFLLLGVVTWRAGTMIQRNAQHGSELAWVNDLASMIHVSMIGFAVGGAFLSLAYFDLPYYEAVLMCVAREIVKEAKKNQVAAAARTDELRQLAPAPRRLFETGSATYRR